MCSTLEFSASRGTVSGFIIAGHAGAPGTPVYQPTISPVNYLNDVSIRSSRPKAYSDAAWAPFTDVAPYIYSESSVTEYDYVIGVKYSTQINVGEPVCISGAASGTSCGPVLRKGVTVEVYDPIARQIYWLLNQVAANYTAIPGDSGAPIFQVVRVVKPDYPKEVVILGIHVGGKPEEYFSPIDGIERDLGIVVITT